MRIHATEEKVKENESEEKRKSGYLTSDRLGMRDDLRRPHDDIIR